MMKSISLLQNIQAKILSLLLQKYYLKLLLELMVLLLVEFKTSLLMLHPQLSNRFQVKLLLNQLQFQLPLLNQLPIVISQGQTIKKKMLMRLISWRLMGPTSILFPIEFCQSLELIQVLTLMCSRKFHWQISTPLLFLSKEIIWQCLELNTPLQSTSMLIISLELNKQS